VADNTLETRITTDTSGVKAGTQEGATAFEQATNSIKDSISGMNSHIASAQSAISGNILQMTEKLTALAPAAIAAAAAFAAFEIVKIMTEAFTSFAGTVEKLSETLGISTQAASDLSVTLKVLGLSSESYIAVMMRMERQLKQHEERFTNLGVAVRDTTTNAFLPMPAILDNVIAKIQEFKPGTDQMQAAMEMLGPRGAQLYVQLIHLKEAAAIAGPLMRELGLEMSGADTEGARQFEMQSRALGEVWEALKVKIGQEIIPALGGFISTLKGMAPIIEDIIFLTKGLMTAFMVISTPINMAMQPVLGILTSIADLMAGIMIAAQAAYEHRFKDAWQEIKNAGHESLEDLKGGLLGMGRAFDTTGDAITKLWSKMQAGPAKAPGTKPFIPPETGTPGAEKSQMQEWRNQLDQMQIEEQAFYGISASTEKAFWEQKLAEATKGSKDWYAVQHQIFELEKKDHKQSLDDELADLSNQHAMAQGDLAKQISLQDQKASLIKSTLGTENSEYRRAMAERQKLVEEQIKQEIETAQKILEANNKVALQSIEIRKMQAESQLALGKITATEEAQIEQNLINEKFGIENNLYNAIAAIWEKYPAKWQEVQNKLSAISGQHAIDIEKINNKLELETKKTWDGFLAPVNSAINTSVQGMIMGTQTLQRTMANLFQNILISFISTLIQNRLKWIENELFKATFGEGIATKDVAIHAAAEVAKTGATEAGTGARVLAEQTGATQGLAAYLAASIKVAFADAARAASGAYAAMAGIPYVGPIVAPIAAAAAFAGVMAFETMIPSAAQGWDVDRTGLTMIHDQEMVLPANIAEGFRGMFAGAASPAMAPAGGSGSSTINIQAWDSRDMQSFMNRHGSKLMKSLRGSARNFNLPSLIRRTR